MRCFIAIELAPELRQSVWDKTATLRATSADVRWVAERNFHLTMKFLGDTPQGAIEGISRALDKAVAGLTEFDLAFRGCGAFPNLRNPHVVWIGLVGFGRLMAIQSVIEPAMAAMGFPPDERAFSPHLTIGRVKSPRGANALADEVTKLKAEEFGCSHVSGVALMQSELRPDGPVYTRLYEAPLEGLE